MRGSLDEVISRFPQRSKVTEFKPFKPPSNQKRNFFAESIDKIDQAVDAVGSDAGQEFTDRCCELARDFSFFPGPCRFRSVYP